MTFTEVVALCLKPTTNFFSFTTLYNYDMVKKWQSIKQYFWYCILFKPKYWWVPVIPNSYILLEILQRNNSKCITADSGWAFNGLSCRVRCNGWIDCVCEAKWQTLLGRNDHVLSGKKHVAVFPGRTLAFPPSNVCHFASQRNQFNRYNECDNWGH